MKITRLDYVTETFRNWHSGMLSFIAQRVTGLALVLYLVLHLVSLSTILVSNEAFTTTLTAYNTPLFKVMEWLLLVAVVFHMLNGIRIIIADWFGLTRLQRGMFWVASTATVAICLASIPFFFLWR